MGKSRGKHAASAPIGAPKAVLPAIAVGAIAVLAIVLFFTSGSPLDGANDGIGAYADAGVDKQDLASTGPESQTEAESTSETPPAPSQPEFVIPENLAIPHETDDRAATSASLNDVKPSERVVYLTFDDGPSSHTSRILDTLDKYGIKATWFVCGNATNLEATADIWNRGHQVGIHSDTHDYPAIYASPDAFFADMTAAGEAISLYTGSFPTILRFPGGSVSGYTQGVLDSLKEGIAARNWHYFDWNVTIGDSTVPMSSVEELMDNIRETSEGCNSCNVLMHDFDAKSSTVDALEQVIQHFISQGYRFDYLTADSFGYHF